MLDPIHISSHTSSSLPYSVGTTPNRNHRISNAISSPPPSHMSDAHNHLLIFPHPDALPLYDLQILQSAQHVMLHLENRLHAKLCAFFDGEWSLLEPFELPISRQIDDYIGPTFDRQG